MLTTLHRVLDELNQDDQSSGDYAIQEGFDHRLIMQRIRQVTDSILSTTDRDFVPTYDTRYYDFCRRSDGGDIDGGDLLLRRELLELDEVTQDSVVVDSSTYTTQPRGKNQHYTRIRLTDDDVWELSGNIRDNITVKGFWGYTKDLRNVWIDTLDTVQDNPLSSTETTLTVSDVDGADVQFNTPRISPGHVLRVEDELMLVTNTDDSGNTVTVVRGYNGTTPVAHDQSTPIQSANILPDVNLAATRWVTYWFRYRSSFEQVRVEGLSQSVIPPMPEHVKNVLTKYPRRKARIKVTRGR